MERPSRRLDLPAFPRSRSRPRHPGQLALSRLRRMGRLQLLVLLLRVLPATPGGRAGPSGAQLRGHRRQYFPAGRPGAGRPGRPRPPRRRPAAAPVRRNTALLRASNSRALNGFAR